jgi:hypothetical protein
MKKYFLSRQILLGFMVCSAPYVHATIPTMEVLSDGTHYRYLLYDGHTDYLDGRNTIAQHNDILWALQQKESKDTFLLVEDSHSYEGTNKLLQNYESGSKTIEDDVLEIQRGCGIDDPESVKDSTDIFSEPLLYPMARLSRQAHRLGIRAYNTECGQLLQRYENGANITKEEVINNLLEYTSEVGRITKLSNYHNFLMKELQELKQIAVSNDDEKFVDKAGRVRRFLVDAITLLKLTEWKDITHGFICEGGAHIDAVGQNLERMGYKRIKIIGLHENGSYRDFFKKFEDHPNPKIAEIYVVQNPLNVKKEFADIFVK